MPSTREDEKTEDDEPDDPIEYMAHKRAKIAEQFSKIIKQSSKENSSTSYDVEQNVREIRALIAVNAEIFDRCMESMKDKTNPVKIEATEFIRYGYEVVKAQQVDTDSTQFITHAEQSIKSFDTTCLSTVPHSLSKLVILSKRTDSYSMFADFESFFINACALHDEVLGPFFAELKDHLQLVQVCLGNIDEWLMESHGNIRFLESIFEKKLEIPVGLKCVCEEGTHTPKDNCFDCKFSFQYHTIAGFPNACPVIDGARRHFKCNRPIVLKICSTPGTYIATFVISYSKDQLKLKKLLEYCMM